MSRRLLADRFLPGLGVMVEERPTKTFADGGFDDFDVVFLESPSNPGLDLIDLQTVANQMRDNGGVTVADNTTMTRWASAPWIWASTSLCPRTPRRWAGIPTC